MSQRRRAIARVIDAFWPGSARAPRLKRFLGVAEQPHQHSAISPVQPRLHWTLRQVGSAALPSPPVCPLSPPVSLILHTTTPPCTASSSSSRRRPRPLTSSCQANDRERNNCRENQVDAPHPNLGRVDPNRLLSSSYLLCVVVVFWVVGAKPPQTTLRGKAGPSSSSPGVVFGRRRREKSHLIWPGRILVLKCLSSAYRDLLAAPPACWLLVCALWRQDAF